MRISMFAAAPADVIALAFFDSVTEEFAPTVQFASPTVIRFAYPGQGLVTTVTGVGLGIVPLTGTITQIDIHTTGGTLAASMTDFSWPLANFVAALENDGNTGFAYWNGLLNLQPVTIDLTQTSGGIDISILTENVTAPLTVLGGPGNDELITAFGNDTISGGDGDDYISAGSNWGEDIVDPGRGNDTIDGQDFEFGYLEIRHAGTAGTGQIVTINGTGGTIFKGAGNGTTTLVNMFGVTEAGWADVGIVGSNVADVFNVTPAPGAWIGIYPGAGNDQINLGISTGTVRLALNWANGQNATQGAVVNLGTGIIANDGFGFQDTITGIGNLTLELQGTNHADHITGSQFNDRFTLRGGNDTVDGGAGNDLVRYDRSQIQQGVNVDLAAGTATGAWSGVGFTQTLISIESIRGSSFDDTLRGSGANETLMGNAGNDLIYGGGGNDYLSGGTGNDTLYGGDGDDYLNPGDGNASAGDEVIDAGRGDDVIDTSSAFNSYVWIEHRGLTNVGQTIFVDGNHGFIDKGVHGTTELWGLDVPILGLDGLTIVGSDTNDIFDITMLSGGRIELRPGRGDDHIELDTLDDYSWASVRLSYHRGADGAAPTQGIVADLSQGIVSNDGFGFTDTIIFSDRIELQIRATNHADLIIGSNADEAFVPGGGNDTLHGGGGFDTLRYDRAEMTSGIRADLGAGTVTGSWQGVAFAHTLGKDFEQIRGTAYDDRILGSDAKSVLVRGDLERLVGGAGNDTILGDGFQIDYYAQEAAQVYRLYHATLGRDPDKGGIANWTSQIAWGQTTAQGVAAGFTNSPEFLKTYGALDDAGFVSLMYQNVLGRSASQGEIDAWLARMQGGQGREQVALGFSDSPEFIRNTAADAASFIKGGNPANWVDDIYRLYLATLGREPDAGGLFGWADRLVDRVNTLETAAAGFVASREFQNVYGTLGDAGFVSLMYQNVLGRAASQGEINAWLSRMAGGESRAEVVLGFSQSNEFINATQGSLLHWVRDVTWVDDEIHAGTGVNIVAGGALADRFVFDATVTGTTTVLDFEVWDQLILSRFGYQDDDAVMERFSQSGNSVVFSDGGVEIMFLNATLNMFDTNSNVWWS